MGNDDVLKAEIANALIQVEAMRNLTHEQTKAVISIRADLNRMAEAAVVLVGRVLELERQVSALQAAIRPRSV